MIRAVRSLVKLVNWAGKISFLATQKERREIVMVVISGAKVWSLLWRWSLSSDLSSKYDTRL